MWCINYKASSKLNKFIIQNPIKFKMCRCNSFQPKVAIVSIACLAAIQINQLFHYWIFIRSTYINTNFQFQINLQVKLEITNSDDKSEYLFQSYLQIINAKKAIDLSGSLSSKQWKLLYLQILDFMIFVLWIFQFGFTWTLATLSHETEMSTLKNFSSFLCQQPLLSWGKGFKKVHGTPPQP